MATEKIDGIMYIIRNISYHYIALFKMRWNVVARSFWIDTTVHFGKG